MHIAKNTEKGFSCTNRGPSRLFMTIHDSSASSYGSDGTQRAAAAAAARHPSAFSQSTHITITHLHARVSLQLAGGNNTVALPCPLMLPRASCGPCA